MHVYVRIKVAYFTVDIEDKYLYINMWIFGPLFYESYANGNVLA